MPFRLFFPSAPEGARATTAPVIAGRSRLAPPGTAHKRLPAGRATAAGRAVASSPANDLGNFALRGNFAVRGDKARVARAEVPRNAEFPRYGRVCTAVRPPNRRASAVPGTAVFCPWPAPPPRVLTAAWASAGV